MRSLSVSPFVSVFPEACRTNHGFTLGFWNCTMLCLGALVQPLCYVFGRLFPSSSTCPWIPRNFLEILYWWFLPICFFCAFFLSLLLFKSQAFWTNFLFFHSCFPFLYPFALCFREFPQNPSIEYCISTNVLLINKNFCIWVFLFESTLLLPGCIIFYLWVN